MSEKPRSLAPCPEGRERPTDSAFMRQALALGERHLGLTAPNPSVGAVLVDESGASTDRSLARAVTAPGGRPHAEKLALEAAGPRARGASLFVTLEPCAHHGRTPPCVDAVIAAGIGRVVCGVEDPDPRVGGKGLDRLRHAGIEVVTGVLEAQVPRSACGTYPAGHATKAQGHAQARDDSRRLRGLGQQGPASHHWRQRQCADAAHARALRRDHGGCRHRARG